ncbi:MAG: hypothetical protein HY866_05060 [Chloroflexi bacterium]|nr:hypothetical protein [Chloroflexota bacterium]
MKKIARWMPVLVMLAVLIVAALPAAAQDGANPLCSGLSDEDCQLLVVAQTNAESITSFASPEWSVSLQGQTAEESISFDAKGSGEFSMASETDFVIHLVIDEATAVSSTGTETLSIEMIVTPAMVYVLYDGEWYADEMTAEDLESLGLGSLAGAGDMLGGAEGEGLPGVSDLTDMGIDLTGVVTTTRGADVDGNAVFATNIDLTQLVVALLSSPMIGEVLGMSMGGEGSETPAMTPEDMQMMAMFIQPMFAGTTIAVEEWVGLEDQMLHGLKADVLLNLDASMLAPEIGKITGEFHFLAGIENINEPVEVTLPETTKPLDELEDPFQGITEGLGM